MFLFSVIENERKSRFQQVVKGDSMVKGQETNALYGFRKKGNGDTRSLERSLSVVEHH